MEGLRKAAQLTHHSSNECISFLSPSARLRRLAVRLLQGQLAVRLGACRCMLQIRNRGVKIVALTRLLSWPPSFTSLIRKRTKLTCTVQETGAGQELELVRSWAGARRGRANILVFLV